MTYNEENDDENENNQRALQDAATIQQDTLEALSRIQIQAAETELTGMTTLAELQQHREQMDRILQDGDRLHDQLDTTQQLQNKFGRWAWKRTDLAARKELEAAKSLQKKKEKKQKKRDSRIAEAAGIATATTSESSSPTKSLKTSSSVKSPLKKKKNRKKNKKWKNKRQVEDESSESYSNDDDKGLLYGMNDATATDNAYGKEIQNLADTDAVIDTEIDNINSQLDTLLELSKTVNLESKRQDCTLEEITKQMEDANDKQAIANSRARRFLTGNKRSEYDKKFSLFGIF